MLDYTKSPLVEQLRELHAPFDIIFDAIGIQDLYASSADYLVPSGKFISISVQFMYMDTLSGAARDVVRFLGNFLWPAWAGGTPRKFLFVDGRMLREDMQIAADLAQEGRLGFLLTDR